MKVAKWGNSLAIRLPAELVTRLGLIEGDDLDVVAKDRTLEVSRALTRAEAMEGLKKFRGRLPADFKFDREWANSRGADDED